MKRVVSLVLILFLLGGAVVAAQEGTSTLPSAAGSAKRAKKQKAKVAGARTLRMPTDLKVVQSIVFKQVGDTKLDLDLFLPLEKKFEKSPLVVYIHGGGWGGGDKYKVLRPAYLDVVRELNRLGITCASIEYRLSKVGVATAYESAADCKDAVRYLMKRADDFGIDADRVGTFGTSAGGHLTLVTALGIDSDYPCDPSLNGASGKIRCVAAYYPLVSLVDAELTRDSNFQNPQRLVPILGGLLEEKQEIARLLSPLDLLRADSPAIFLAHGDADQALSYRNSTALCDAAEKLGVPVECIISKGAAHGFAGEAIDPTIEEINRRTVAFFLKHLTD